MLGLIASIALACSAPAHPGVSAVDAEVLLGLRDLAGLSLSPDGRYAAFQVQRADADSDRYQSAWCATDLDTGRTFQLGDGGDIILPILPGSQRRTGVWATLTARWRPDGQAIAVLTRRSAPDDDVQIESCALQAETCQRVTRSAGDIVDFVWSADGQGFIFQARPSREAVAAALAREGDDGFLFDGRFDVFHRLAPIRLPALGPPPLAYADARTGEERPATAEEAVRFAQARRAPLSTSMGTSRADTDYAAAPISRPSFLSDRDTRDVVRSPAQTWAWTEPADPALAGSSPLLALWASRHDAAPLRCAAPACQGRIVEMSWTPDAQAVLFVRREGWGESRHALFLWDVADNRVRAVWNGDEALRVCTPRAREAVCFFEHATQPRIVVAVDYASGALRPVFDPNPHLRASAFAPARKLEWRTPLGDDVFGYVLTPAASSHGVGPWPLIVVQYRATGFLRGGVGDEYPIQAFVRRGFAVLALERPDPFALRARIRDGAEIDRREWAGLSERRRTLAALTSGIDRLVELGVADRERVGVTGLSDGAETIVFGLIHCGCIAAAAISGGVHDPISLYFTSDANRAAMRAGGRGVAGSNEDRLWDELSLARNAPRIDTPILAQVADRELVFLLEAERAFADLNRPFELYVFPDEYHIKWRPRHRRAIYRRSIQWFEFWLRAEEDADPVAPDQYARWRVWRAAAP